MIRGPVAFDAERVTAGIRRINQRQVDVVSDDRAEDLAPPSSARDQHVQAPLSAVRAERPEVHRHVAAGVAAVADGNEDDVALVTLDVLQVLQEEWFVLGSAEEIL